MRRWRTVGQKVAMIGQSQDMRHQPVLEEDGTIALRG